jgi:hypothetical protein
VACAGDVNGDGYDDVLAGAFLYDNGESNEGRAWLFLGSAAGLSTSPAWTAEGDQVLAKYGYSVASAGDVNQGTFADIIVGVPHHHDGQDHEGGVFVFLGSASGPSLVPDWGAEADLTLAHLGFTVASAGDVNRDGRSDVVAGAPYSHGEVLPGWVSAFYGLPPGGGILEAAAASPAAVLEAVRPQAAHVRLALYDAGGRCVASLAAGAQTAGRHVATWDGRRDGGRAPAAPGIYFLRLDADGAVTAVRKVVLAH